jgi:hypothetical protein
MPKSESRRQLVIVVAFALSMGVVSIAGVFVANVEPGATRVGAAALAALTFLLAVLGVLPLGDQADVSINLVRRALRAAAKNMATTVVGAAVMFALASSAWALGPRAIISEAVVCSGAKVIHHHSWDSMLVALECNESRVALTTWQPAGRQAFVQHLDCISSTGAALKAVDDGTLAGFRCPDAEPPPAPPAPTLELINATVSTDGVLDVTFRNPNDVPIDILRLEGTVIEALGASPMPVLLPDAKFALEFSTAGVGATATATLSYVVPRRDVGRFTVKLRLSSAAKVRLDFHYDAASVLSVTRDVSF